MLRCVTTAKGVTMSATAEKRNVIQDTSYHDRFLAEQLEDPEFREEFERQRENIEALDALVNQLDDMREKLGMSKAELARAIGKPPESVRRWLTTQGNPQLATIVAMVHALGYELEMVPAKTQARRRRPTRSRAAARVTRRRERTAAAA